MQFAISHDAIPTGHPADVDETSVAKQRRVSTTATVVAVALCAFAAQGHLLAARTPTRVAAATQDTGTAPVTVIAPEFCKDQTWPYIDSRCLRRVDPPLPVDDHKPIAPVTTAAAPTAAPPTGDGVSANNVAAAPTNAQTAAATNAPPPAAAAPSQPDARAQVIQSVFPAAPLSAAPDNGGNVAPDTYRHTSDVSQHRRSRHWNNHSGFFGFRF